MTALLKLDKAIIDRAKDVSNANKFEPEVGLGNAAPELSTAALDKAERNFASLRPEGYRRDVHINTSV